MKLIRLFAASALILGAVSASANELDPVAPNAPEALIVRENAQGEREIFKAGLKAEVNDAAAAKKAVENFVTNDNRVQDIQQGTELDQVSSDDSWHYWYDYSYSYRPYSYTYYTYNCYNGGYRYVYSYRPVTYSYYSYGYRYYYYYPSYSRYRW